MAIARNGLLTSLAVLALTGCGGADGPPAADTDRPGPAPMTPADRARAAVAARLDIGPEEVKLVSVEARDFPDSSLDCPEPDMAYQQVITPGHRVIVEADGRRFDVRVSGAGARICYRRKGGSGSQRASPVQRLAEQARADLANRLQSDVAEVSISGIRALGPDDTLPGCNWSCPADAGVCGYAVSLDYAERRFDYFVNQSRMSPCPPIVSS
jgi:hypothetical protein